MFRLFLDVATNKITFTSFINYRLYDTLISLLFEFYSHLNLVQNFGRVVNSDAELIGMNSAHNNTVDLTKKKRKQKRKTNLKKKGKERERDSLTTSMSFGSLLANSL